MKIGWILQIKMIKFKQEQITELTDEHGNTIQIKSKKVYNKREFKIIDEKSKKVN